MKNVQKNIYLFLFSAVMAGASTQVYADGPLTQSADPAAQAMLGQASSSLKDSRLVIDQFRGLMDRKEKGDMASAYNNAVSALNKVIDRDNANYQALQQIQGNVKQYQDQNTQLQNQLTNWNNQANDLQNKITTEQQQLQQLQAQEQAAQSQIGQAQDQSQQMQTQLKALQDQLTASDAANADLKAKYDALVAQRTPNNSSSGGSSSGGGGGGGIPIRR